LYKINAAFVVQLTLRVF